MIYFLLDVLMAGFCASFRMLLANSTFSLAFQSGFLTECRLPRPQNRVEKKQAKTRCQQHTFLVMGEKTRQS